MQRRTFLGSVAAVSGSFLSGCSSSGDGQAENSLTLFNYSDSKRTVTVRVEDGGGETLLDEKLDLEPDGSRNLGFSGTPASATVAVDGGDTSDVDWPDAEFCESEDDVPGLEVVVNAADEATFNWNCQ